MEPSASGADQRQLPAYLLAITKMPNSAALFGAREVIAAGVFFLPLKPRFEKGATRDDVLVSGNEAVRKAFAHHGLFNLEMLPHLDSLHDSGKSGQFVYNLKKDGTPNKTSFSALEPDRFQALLERTGTLLHDFGERIYAGDTRIHPYARGQENACQHCDFLSICRFDPWTQDYNRLTPPEEGA